MKRLLPFAALALLIGATSTFADKVDTETVVESNTRFALDLYEHLKGEKGNLFFSPYSISSAFAMTYAGAKGDTAKEMKKVFAFTENDKLNQGFQALNATINGDPNEKRGYKLAVANSLWGQKGYPWNKDFLATGKKFYDAGLQDVDFVGATEQARQTINKWVEKQTNEKIKDLLPKGILDSNTRLVLTNAIYFKGDWASQFKSDATKDQLFHMDGGKSAKVRMMNQTGKYFYGEDRDLQVLKLPYVGKNLEMVVLLPKGNDGLPRVEKSLTPNNLARWLETTRETKVEVGLPKFKIESGFGLKGTLMKMGMPTPFTFGKADFSGMATAERLYIQDAVHKAFVEVNEEGTEAAAATGVVVGTKSLPPPTPKFVADHPFVFLIRDARTSSVLFLGRYSEVSK